MKKILLILTIGFFAACGSDSSNATSADSASIPSDTGNPVNPPPPDTAKIMKDTSHVMGDTSSGKDSMSH